MSAALDIQLFIDYFGKCPVVNGMSWFKGTLSHISFSINLRARLLTESEYVPFTSFSCEYSSLRMFKATLYL